jgi:hypothetical protein
MLLFLPLSRKRKELLMCSSQIPCVFAASYKPFVFVWFFMVRNRCLIRTSVVGLCRDEYMCKAVQHFPEWFGWVVFSHPIFPDRDFLSVSFFILRSDGICIKTALLLLFVFWDFRNTCAREPNSVQYLGIDQLSWAGWLVVCFPATNKQFWFAGCNC